MTARPPILTLTEAAAARARALVDRNGEAAKVLRVGITNRGLFRSVLQP